MQDTDYLPVLSVGVDPADPHGIIARVYENGMTRCDAAKLGGVLGEVLANHARAYTRRDHAAWQVIPTCNDPHHAHASHAAAMDCRYPTLAAREASGTKEG